MTCNRQTTFASLIRRFAVYPIVSMCILLEVGCSGRNDGDYSGVHNSIDSLLLSGGTRYDVANYLLRHPEYTDENFSDAEFSASHESHLSPDKRLRVYSVYEEGFDDYYWYRFYNIAHYKTSLSKMMVKADINDDGLVLSIGEKQVGQKTYYLLVSLYRIAHQGEYYTFTLRAYSVDDHSEAFEPEFLFKTANGKLLHSITVNWDDYGNGYNGDNLFGVDFDSEYNTSRINVQVIEPRPGEPLNKALVYNWDGQYYTFGGITDIEPRSSEKIKY